LITGFFDMSTRTVLILMVASWCMTVASSELYFHRSRTHRSVTFHPILTHIFRFYVMMTAYGVTAKSWVAVHRKHHSKSDTVDDPHSPVIHGFWSILLKGTLYYRKSARDAELLRTYGVGIEEDWMDRNVYTKYRFRGLFVWLVAAVVLFGMKGLYLWLWQISVAPIWAAGFINSVYHHIGYRNFETKDNSRNFLPIGIFLGGSEMHNNHHANPASAKMSVKWWEFDSGYAVMRLLSLVGLAKINRV